MLTKVDTIPDKPEKPKKAESQISAPKFAILTVPLKNAPGSPLVVNAFSAKARETMRLAQQAGSVGKKNKKRDPKDFDAAYHNARHISRDNWDGVTCATFRNAMISACRLVGFKMTIGKLSVFIEADGNSAADGTPLVRIHGEPVPFEAAVCNVCRDPQCHRGEYCYPEGRSVRFGAMEKAPRDGSVIVVLTEHGEVRARYLDCDWLNEGFGAESVPDCWRPVEPDSPFGDNDIEFKEARGWRLDQPPT